MSLILKRVMVIRPLFNILLCMLLSLFSVKSLALVCYDANGGGNSFPNVIAATGNVFPGSAVNQKLYQTGISRINLICKNTSNVPEQISLKFDVDMGSILTGNVNANKAEFSLYYNNNAIPYNNGDYIQLADNMVAANSEKAIEIEFYFVVKMNSAPTVIPTDNSVTFVTLQLTYGDRRKIEQSVINDLFRIKNILTLKFPTCSLNLDMQINPSNIDFGTLIYDNRNSIRKSKNFNLRFLRDVNTGCSLNQLSTYSVDMYFQANYPVDPSSSESLDLGNGLGLRIIKTNQLGRAENVTFNSNRKIEGIFSSNVSNSPINTMDFEAEIFANNKPVRPGPFTVPVTINVDYH